MFGSSGVRGVVGKEINPRIALKIGEACGTLYKDVIIGNDPRTSSIMLKNAVTAGLLSCGSKIVDAGLSPTPAIAYEARNHDIGIMITASHNPAEYNGIKIFEKDGSGIPIKKAHKIEKMIERDEIKYVGWEEYGFIEKKNIMNDYMDAILKEVGSVEKRKKIIVDCSNGAASVTTPYILRKMGMSVITLNCNPDGFFPAHNPEPIEKNLQQLKTLCVKEKIFGLAHDCDADRMVAVTPDGELLQNEKLMILFANYIGAKKIVVPIDTSMILDDYFDGEIIRTKVGDIYISEKLKQQGGFGAEASGTWTFPSFSYSPDGILAAAKFAKMMEDMDLMDEIGKIPSYPIVRESIKGARDKIDVAIKKIEEEIDRIDYVNLIKIDGYRIEFEDGWVLIRKSGTEPKIRLTVEAKDDKKLKELNIKFMNMIKRCLK